MVLFECPIVHFDGILFNEVWLRRDVYMNILIILDPTEMCSRVLVTCYMGSENSSEETKNRAKVDN